MSRAAILLLLCLYWLYFIQVSSIVCYSCFSTISWHDCNQNAMVTNCSQYMGHKFDACVQQYVEIPPKTKNDTRITRYARRCSYMERCKNLEKECNGFCKASCCDTDRCNSASLGRVGSTVLFCSIMYSLYTVLAETG